MAKAEVITNDRINESSSWGEYIKNWNAVRARAKGPRITQTLLLTSLVL